MKVHWTRQAERDYIAAFEFLIDGSPRAATTFARRVATQIKVLERHALAGPVGRVPGTREFFVARTPYFAVYRLEEGRVMILRLLHQAQNWTPDSGASI